MVGVGINKPVTIILVTSLALCIAWGLVSKFETDIGDELRALHQYFYAYLSIYEDREDYDFTGEKKREKHEEKLDDMLQHIPHID
jgi:hypothetical protein